MFPLSASVLTQQRACTASIELKVTRSVYEVQAAVEKGRSPADAVQQVSEQAASKLVSK